MSSTTESDDMLSEAEDQTDAYPDAEPSSEPGPEPESDAARQAREAAIRAAAAEAAMARFSAQQQQGALPSKAEIEGQKQLAAAKDKLVKALVGRVMDYHINRPSQSLACIDTLLQLVNNILQEPTNTKMRQVKATSKVWTTKIQPTAGAEDFLRAAGWRKRTEDFQAFWGFEGQPGSFTWKVMELASKELQKSQAEVANKAHRAEEAQSAAAKAKAGLGVEREHIVAQVKADHDARKDRFVYK